MESENKKHKKRGNEGENTINQYQEILKKYYYSKNKNKK